MNQESQELSCSSAVSYGTLRSHHSDYNIIFFYSDALSQLLSVITVVLYSALLCDRLTRPRYLISAVTWSYWHTIYKDVLHLSFFFLLVPFIIFIQQSTHTSNHFLPTVIIVDWYISVTICFYSQSWICLHCVIIINLCRTSYKQNEIWCFSLALLGPPPCPSAPVSAVTHAVFQGCEIEIFGLSIGGKVFLRSNQPWILSFGYIKRMVITHRRCCWSDSWGVLMLVDTVSTHKSDTRSYETPFVPPQDFTTDKRCCFFWIKNAYLFLCCQKSGGGWSHRNMGQGNVCLTDMLSSSTNDMPLIQGCSNKFING